jgi:diacylglycerol kinase (ATP)
MKNQPFARRLGFALGGIADTLHSERSFRVHAIAAAGITAVMLWLQPAPIWWAVVALAVALVLVAELVNTAIEHLADHLHPESHPGIKRVKDCAAAAVLIESLSALVVGAALAFNLFVQTRAIVG